MMHPDTQIEYLTLDHYYAREYENISLYLFAKDLSGYARRLNGDLQEARTQQLLRGRGDLMDLMDTLGQKRPDKSRQIP